MAFTWGLVVLVSAFAVSTVQYKNDCNLYRITQVSGEVEVIRDGKTMMVSQDDLVPDDVISVRPGLAYCDMVLVSAARVLVDESALTGEATPVGKVSLDPHQSKDNVYDEIKVNKKNIIFAGTTILEASTTDKSGANSRAIVLKTALYTARGELIRDIFSYKRQIFKFDTEVPIVITILFFYALFGWIMAFHWTGEIFVYGFFYGIYVVGGCLPPVVAYCLYRLCRYFQGTLGQENGCLHKRGKHFGRWKGDPSIFRQNRNYYQARIGFHLCH